MGSGSYSFAVYASLASDRGYATKSADAVFTNHSLSAKSDIKLSNVDARTYNTHRRVLVITHRDEITSQFNDELLSGDWEEQFNSIRTSYYDKLAV